MTAFDLSFGIPDIELSCTSGAKINPSSFVGHELIALFCPLDHAAAAQEIAAYRDHSPEFAQRDAWLLAFADNCGDIAVDGEARLLTLPDQDRHAWAPFETSPTIGEVLDRGSGATFLFTRGGGLHRHWHASGHVDEVLAELRIASFQNPHQLAG